MKSCKAAAAVLLLLEGCSPDARHIPAPNHEWVNVGVTAENGTSTKSSFSASPDGIEGISVLAYRKSDHALVAASHGSSKEVSLKIQKGYDYNFYALANMGDMASGAISEWPSDQVLPEIRFILPELSGAGFMPMAGMASASSSDISENHVVSVPVTRLYSRYGLRLRNWDISGYSIKYVRIQGVPADMKVFSENSTGSSYRKNGDHLTDEDLSTLQSGGTVYLYVPENAKGTSGSGGSNSAKNSKAENLTYLELGYDIDDGDYVDNPDRAATRETDIIYRLYLGTDDGAGHTWANDYNVLRGRDHLLTVTGTAGGLEVAVENGASWRTDTDLIPVGTPVDLGLPSGTLWSDKDFGAPTETGQGKRYAWGEIHTKEQYTAANYIYTNAPNSVTAPGADIQGGEFDVVYLNWGKVDDCWAIPTEQEIRELEDYCVFEEISSPATGWRVMGPNGNSIFLQKDLYWTSGKTPGSGYSSCGYDMTGSSESRLQPFQRSSGLLIRPVYRPVPVHIECSAPMYVGQSSTLTIAFGSGLIAGKVPEGFERDPSRWLIFDGATGANRDAVPSMGVISCKKKETSGNVVTYTMKAGALNTADAATISFHDTGWQIVDRQAVGRVSLPSIAFSANSYSLYADGTGTDTPVSWQAVTDQEMTAAGWVELEKPAVVPRSSVSSLAQYVSVNAATGQSYVSSYRHGYTNLFEYPYTKTGKLDAMARVMTAASAHGTRTEAGTAVASADISCTDPFESMTRSDYYHGINIQDYTGLRKEMLTVGKQDWSYTPAFKNFKIKNASESCVKLYLYNSYINQYNGAIALNWSNANGTVTLSSDWNSRERHVGGALHLLFKLTNKINPEAVCSYDAGYVNVYVHQAIGGDLESYSYDPSNRVITAYVIAEEACTTAPGLNELNVYLQRTQFGSGWSGSYSMTNQTEYRNTRSVDSTGDEYYDPNYYTRLLACIPAFTLTDPSNKYHTGVQFQCALSDHLTESDDNGKPFYFVHLLSSIVKCEGSSYGTPCNGWLAMDELEDMEGYYRIK